MKSTLVPSFITLLAALLPLTALAQDAEKPKKAKKTAKADAAEEAAEQAEAEGIATLQASHAALEQQLAELQSKLEASAANDESQKALEDLATQVDTLDKKLEAQAEESREADKAMEATIAAMAPGSGFMIKGPGESFLKIGGLLQVRMESTKDAAPNGDSWDFDSYLRRMRLMFYGQLNKWVNFFIETDNPNFGKGGEWDVSNTFIQDAYLEINVHEAFQVDLGMLLLPFSHQGMQGATTLFGMDYHTGLVKYPSRSQKVWRDAGVMLRGLLAKKHIEYRFGLFNGARGKIKTAKDPLDPRNPKDLPRLTGRLTFNVFEAEGGAGAGGMFYDGLYLSKTDAGIISPKTILAIGGSIDWQPDLNVEINNPAARANATDPYGVVDTTDYLAAAWDIFWDIPLGAKKIMSLNGQVNGYYYNHGDRSADVTTVVDETGANVDLPTNFAYYNVIGDTASYTGLGLMSEVGFRYNWIQPLVMVDFFKSTKSDLPAAGDVADMAAYCAALGVKGCGENMGDMLAVYGGLNFYLLGHNTTFKLQAGAVNKNGADDWTPSVHFQGQLLF